MSHASGAVKFKDGRKKYYEYNGTSDVCISHLYDTFEEMSDNWRQSEWLSCECGEEEEVEIYSSYGFGFCFKGKACKNCRSISHDGYSKDIWEGTINKTEPNWLIEYNKIVEAQNDKEG